MNGGRDQFLSRASLADQKHTRVGRSHLFNLLKDMPKCRTLADQTVMMATDNFYFVLQIYIFAVQLVA